MAHQPLTSKVIVDHIVQANYGINVKPITSRNPQADSISERIHQKIGNIIRIFKVEDMVLNASTMFVLRATLQTTMQYTQTSLVFGQDLILNTRHETNWQITEKHKQDLVNKRNQQEN